jgi:hypothetical protein
MLFMNKPLIPRQVIKDWLSTSSGNLTFTKKDGTRRTMKCTLNPDLMPPEAFPTSTDSTKKKAENLEVLPVWDLDQNAFRSFRIDSIISWEPIFTADCQK